MQKYFLFFTAVLITALSSRAQYIVKGCVTDTIGEGEPYATVRIYNQSNKEKPVKMSVTDIDGRFMHTLTDAGKYTLQISSVGKLTLNEDFEVSST